MYISEIQERIMRCVNQIRFDCAKGYVLMHGANDKEMKDAYHVALWLEGAGKDVKLGFIKLWGEMAPDRYQDSGLRVCSHCGQFMIKGYVLGDEYACSEPCAVELFRADYHKRFGMNQAPAEARRDLTEWYQEL